MKIFNQIEKNQVPKIFGGELEVKHFWPPMDTFPGVKEKLNEKEMLELDLRPFYTVDEYDFEIFEGQLKDYYCFIQEYGILFKKSFNREKNKEEIIEEEKGDSDVKRESNVEKVSLILQEKLEKSSILSRQKSSKDQESLRKSINFRVKALKSSPVQPKSVKIKIKYS